MVDTMVHLPDTMVDLSDTMALPDTMAPMTMGELKGRVGLCLLCCCVVLTIVRRAASLETVSLCEIVT